MKFTCLFAGTALMLGSLVPATADHHEGHTTASSFLVDLGEGEMQVELSVSKGQMVTARLLDKAKKPVSIDAAAITFTFTEPDGEKEDYSIDAAADGKGAVFQKKSSHVVHHVVRDKMSITVKVAGKEHTSKTFAYPYGHHGGKLLSLGKSQFFAELVIDGDIVRVHMLNSKKRPTATDAKEITLTFTESDGEVEDYEIPVGKSSGKGTIYERDDEHVVKHVKRDKMSIKLASGGKSVTSKEFHYLKK